MFGIDSSEFLLIAVVALLVIGPKDLPRVMRLVGGWVGRGRAMTRHLRSGFDTMMREAELEEMQKQWAKQNADIMAATQAAPVPTHDYSAPVFDAGEVPVVQHDGATPDPETVRHARESGNDDDKGEKGAVMTGPQPAALQPVVPSSVAPQPATPAAAPETPR